MKRYEVRTGKWGQYHYDKHWKMDLTLEQVTELLNSIGELKSELETAQFKLAAKAVPNQSIRGGQ